MSVKVEKDRQALKLLVENLTESQVKDFYLVLQGLLIGVDLAEKRGA